MSDRICKNCKYFIYVKDQTTMGECHFNAPVGRREFTEFPWPRVFEGHFCGEFEENTPLECPKCKKTADMWEILESPPQSTNLIKDMPTGITMDLGSKPIVPTELRRCFDRLYNELTKVGSSYYTPPKEEPSIADRVYYECPKCNHTALIPNHVRPTFRIQCHKCLAAPEYEDWRNPNR